MGPPEMRRCGYCTQEIVVASDTYLQCVECHFDVHIACLRMSSTPGDLLGDIFFDLTCANCMELQHEADNGDSATGSGMQRAPTEIREKFTRQHLPWLMIITLALYNLAMKSQGLSRDGYFHWRSHITSFITRHWEFLFASTRRKRKNWIGSVSGALSHNNGSFFVSGQEEFGEAGWWKLRHAHLTPKAIYQMYEQQSQNRKRQLEEAASAGYVGGELQEAKRMRSTDPSEEDVALPSDSCSRTRPYMGRKPKALLKAPPAEAPIAPTEVQAPEDDPALSPAPLNTVQSSLMDFLAENLSSDAFSMFNPLTAEPLQPDVAPLHELDHNENANFFEHVPHDEFHDELPTTSAAAAAATADKNLSNFYHDHEETQHQGSNKGHAPIGAADGVDGLSESDQDDETADEFQPRIVKVTNFQQMEPGGMPHEAALNDIKKEPHSDREDQEEARCYPSMDDSDEEDDEKDQEPGEKRREEPLPQCKPSLFTKGVRRPWPWLVEPAVEEKEFLELDEEEVPPSDSSDKLVMMSENEEAELLAKLHRIFSLEEKASLQIPAYIRRFYRRLCVREWKRQHHRPMFDLNDDPAKGLAHGKEHIIDRYQLITSSTADSRRQSFAGRIAGSFQYELFESPYTHRILHPFIYRNTKCFPPWLKLMCEMQHKVSGVVPSRAPIDYCYVRPNHMAAVNALLQSSFWPGIDMSECLGYPDFSVVALYKKLVVGCAFLVPDVGYNEAYISFMAVRPGWQRSGIATFMLYHLIQTCRSKDITLHVSASNPAVVLYQKFGFKIEEVILNFYDKYLPQDSKHSRNAFFLRLMR